MDLDENTHFPIPSDYVDKRKKKKPEPLDVLVSNEMDDCVDRKRKTLVPIYRGRAEMDKVIGSCKYPHRKPKRYQLIKATPRPTWKRNTKHTVYKIKRKVTPKHKTYNKLHAMI